MVDLLALFGIEDAEQAGADRTISEQANPPRRGSLNEALGFEGDWGFATSIAGAFREAITEDGTKINNATEARLGEFALQGLVFARPCSGRTGNSEVDSRHGLEGVLDFWQNHRLGNAGRAGVKAEKVSLRVSVGQTTLVGVMSELQFRPLDNNFATVAWTLGLLVEPRFKSKPLPGQL